MDTLYRGVFSPQEPGLFYWLYRAILEHGDDYFHLADLESYLLTQERAAQEFTQPTVWARKAILNLHVAGKPQLLPERMEKQRITRSHGIRDRKNGRLRRLHLPVAYPRSDLAAAPGKFEVKRRGALEHRNDGMAVPSGGYSASNFPGAAARR